MLEKHAEVSKKIVSLSSNLIKQLKSFDLRGIPSLSDKNSGGCCTFSTTISFTISLKKDQIEVLIKGVLGPIYDRKDNLLLGLPREIPLDNVPMKG